MQPREPGALVGMRSASNWHTAGGVCGCAFCQAGSCRPPCAAPPACAGSAPPCGSAWTSASSPPWSPGWPACTARRSLRLGECWQPPVPLWLQPPHRMAFVAVLPPRLQMHTNWQAAQNSKQQARTQDFDDDQKCVLHPTILVGLTLQAGGNVQKWKAGALAAPMPALPKTNGAYLCRPRQRQQSQRTWNSAAKVASTREERMTSRKAPRVPATGGEADSRLHAGAGLRHTYSAATPPLKQ